MGLVKRSDMKLKDISADSLCLSSHVSPTSPLQRRLLFCHISECVSARKVKRLLETYVRNSLFLKTHHVGERKGCDERDLVQFIYSI